MLRWASLLSRQIVGVIIVVYCIGFWQSATRLPYGPAVLYPQLVIGVLIAFVAADFVVAARAAAQGRAAHHGRPQEAADTAHAQGSGSVRAALAAIWVDRRKVVITALLTAAYLLSLSRLGFYPATAVFLGIMFPALGIRQPVRLLVLWAGSLAVAWGLFTWLLGVRLPRGTLF